MKTIVIKNDWLDRALTLLTFGWGNGYVVIPKHHDLHGIHYDDLNEIVEVHGWLTFSDYGKSLKMFKEIKPEDRNSWIVGFDTAHYMDNAENCNEQFVRDEAERLKVQLEQWDQMDLKALLPNYKKKRKPRKLKKKLKKLMV